MSAPGAVSATAGSTSLPFTSSSILNPLLAVVPVASPYPQALLVDLLWRAVPKALMLALVIVEAEPGANAGLGLGDRRIGIEVDFLVFEVERPSVVINAVGRVGDHKVRRDATEHARNVGRHCAVAAEQP